jgi:hypothetical protein
MRSGTLPYCFKMIMLLILLDFRELCIYYQGMDGRRKFLYSLFAFGGILCGVKAVRMAQSRAVRMNSVTVFPDNIPRSQWDEIEKEIYNLDSFSNLRSDFISQQKIMSDETFHAHNGYSWVAIFKSQQDYQEWVNLTQKHVNLGNLKKYNIKSFFWLT